MRMWACRSGVDLTRPTGGPFVGPAVERFRCLMARRPGPRQIWDSCYLFEFSSQSGVICIFRALESPIPSDR